MKSRRIFFLILFLFVFQAQIAHAQQASLSATPTPVAYTLPYPGILPGERFYFLKELRDGIVAFFISHPIKRAEYDLLQADKKMQAAVFLLTKKNDEGRVFEALVDSQEAFGHALSQVEIAEKQGMGTMDIVARLITANLKYQEVLTELSNGVDGEMKEKLLQRRQLVMQQGKKVKNLAR